MFASNTSQVSSDATYIEDVFSTYLYTGTGANQTITNGIDLAGKGGLVWIKDRPNLAYHCLTDTARGVNKLLFSNLTSASTTAANTVTAFNADGFSLGADASGYGTNDSGAATVSWTFRKQPKFFDVVTYTGNGSTQNISHNLGSTPGCIIVKKVSNVDAWVVWHRSLANNQYLILNSTTNTQSSNNIWNNTAPTSTQFSVGLSGYTNDSSTTYVAYLFAHNAGGFGLTGTDNVISCGSYTGDSASAGKFVSLGFEPQWVLQKCVSTGVTDWHIQDVMRGAPVPSASGKVLRPNSSIAEYDGTNAYPAATGFYATGDDNNSGDTYIYIAIRRGPMKTPTSGTSVFAPVSQAGGGTVTTNFPVDFVLNGFRSLVVDKLARSRLQGGYQQLATSSTAAETTELGQFDFASNTGFADQYFGSGNQVFYECFRRAPGFFDEVCYTGTGVSGLVVNHNLGVTPELLIYKNRATAGTNWFVLNASSNYGNLNSDAAFVGPLSITLGSTSYTINTTGTSTNASGQTYVAYLFASCPGVSKVGSYSGTGGTQTISCGFAARFVLIKRTDSAGDWFVWDTARGMVAGTDPRLALNSTAAESNANWVYTNASGFQIVTTNTAVNASGGTYLYLAIS